LNKTTLDRWYSNLPNERRLAFATPGYSMMSGERCSHPTRGDAPEGEKAMPAREELRFTVRFALAGWPARREAAAYQDRLRHDAALP
jgi:hypothetical protein